MDPIGICQLLKYPPKAEINFTIDLDNEEIRSKVIWDGSTQTLTITENGIPRCMETGAQGLVTFIEILFALNYKTKNYVSKVNS